jgi:hypothetical protein
MLTSTPHHSLMQIMPTGKSPTQELVRALAATAIDPGNDYGDALPRASATRPYKLSIKTQPKYDSVLLRRLLKFYIRYGLY